MTLEHFYFTANNSKNSITGPLDSNATAFAIRASAILPARCAFRTSSVSKVSKIPNVEAPICHPYQFTVSGSSNTNGNALFKNAATSSSFPDLASNRANKAYFSIIVIYRS
ncbi:hypothetical protein [Flavobacterium fryxellicola]|uniref:Uncharacterized protein n=1 Tax=Flavobacterium fryxellicola TaxID=249352 RepID=A0A167YIZ1_9FLAO|nr:hypothetical protein [Flavobacterium fryxellicola]OAB29467.1 hypothetical protein FBFR_04125 [Flavobacterium fryxellicola]